VLDPILIYSYSCLRADALPWDMTGDSSQAMVRCAARQRHSDRPCAVHSTVPTQHTQCDTGHKAALCPVSQAFAEPHSQTTTLYVRMPPPSYLGVLFTNLFPVYSGALLHVQYPNPRRVEWSTHALRRWLFVQRGCMVELLSSLVRFGRLPSTDALTAACENLD
jgi:hypothetical protein